MNAFQEKFYHFILDRVQTDKVEDVKELLAESFAKQSEGTFDVAYLLSYDTHTTKNKPIIIDFSFY